MERNLSFQGVCKDLCRQLNNLMSPGISFLVTFHLTTLHILEKNDVLPADEQFLSTPIKFYVEVWIYIIRDLGTGCETKNKRARLLHFWNRLSVIH